VAGPMFLYSEGSGKFELPLELCSIPEGSAFQSLSASCYANGMKRFLLQLGALLLGFSAFGASPPATRTVYDATLRNGFTIRCIRQESVGNYTRLYTSDSNFIEVPSAEVIGVVESQEPVKITPELQPASDLNQVVSAASDKHQIDPDLIISVIRAESDFNPNARSSKGAEGLMQLMPGTASRLGVANTFDPAANIDGGTQYLRELLLKYNGDMVKALAAYNAGPGRVEQYHGIPPYRETRAYVARVIKDFNKKKLAARKTRPTATSRKSINSSVNGK
jgi:hypothetical protein